MAAAYLEADLGALYRLAELVERQARGELTSSEHGAVTQLEDRFGLTPKARQLLQWQVLAAGEAPATVVATSSPPASSGQASSVRRLRAVDPKAASA
jgi:hypothetical protein